MCTLMCKNCGKPLIECEAAAGYCALCTFNRAIARAAYKAQAASRMAGVVVSVGDDTPNPFTHPRPRPRYRNLPLVEVTAFLFGVGVGVAATLAGMWVAGWFWT